jgi:hypothetical protein
LTGNQYEKLVRIQWATQRFVSEALCEIFVYKNLHKMSMNISRPHYRLRPVLTSVAYLTLSAFMRCHGKVLNKNLVLYVLTTLCLIDLT